MKFYQKEEARPRHRKRDGFLLFPRTIKGETRWLEYAFWMEEWKESQYADSSLGGSFHWEGVHWR